MTVTMTRRSKFHFCVKINAINCIGLLPSDWSRKLARLSPPIRCKTKTNRDFTSVFPRLRQFSCFHVEFSLALRVFCLALIGLCDYFGFG